MQEVMQYVDFNVLNLMQLLMYILMSLHEFVYLWFEEFIDTLLTLLLFTSWCICHASGETTWYSLTLYFCT